MMLSLIFSAVLSSQPNLKIAAIDTGDQPPSTRVYAVHHDHKKVGLFISDGTKCFGDPYFSLDRTSCQPIDERSSMTARWYLIRAQALDYDNVGTCTGKPARSGCHDPIRYTSTELTSIRGRTSFDIFDVAQFSEPGTYLLSGTISWYGKLLAAPRQDIAGANDQSASMMFRLIVRRGADYTGYLSELIGVPFALGPVYLPGRGHQTDLQLAADCVALVIYGRRRLGESVPYMAPQALHERLISIGRADSLMNEAGQVPKVRPLRNGDVLYFEFQTAVIYDGLTADGRILPDTQVIHSYHRLAEVVRVRELPYRYSPVEILRWPDSELEE